MVGGGSLAGADASVTLRLSASKSALGASINEQLHVFTGSATHHRSNLMYFSKSSKSEDKGGR